MHWGRWNSAPAVTVRDPAAASGRLTRWNSWTDGQSPDGKRTGDKHLTFSAAEDAAMRRALEIAATDGVPAWPNPRVGCVLLSPAGEPLAGILA